MIKGADFSECGQFRYSLRRIWDENLPKVMVIGLNPSTANGTDDDRTIGNLTKMLQASGYGGLYMVNLFAFITSKPQKLREVPDPVKDNDNHLEAISKKCDDVIFAWGSFKQAEYRAKKIIPQFPDALCFGKTPKGHPIHPLAASVWMKSKCKLQKFHDNLNTRTMPGAIQGIES